MQMKVSQQFLVPGMQHGQKPQLPPEMMLGISGKCLEGFRGALEE